jgi:hypothetical protein
MKILLILSFITYILLAVMAVNGAFFGVETKTFSFGIGGSIHSDRYASTYYGWEAISKFSFYRVLTILSLIFQSIYIIMRRIKGDKQIIIKAAKIAIISIIILVVTVITPVSIAERRAKSRQDELISNGFIIVNTHFIEIYSRINFGEVQAISIGSGDIFGKRHLPAINYHITIPSLKSSFIAKVDMETSEVSVGLFFIDMIGRYDEDEAVGIVKTLFLLFGEESNHWRSSSLQKAQVNCVIATDEIRTDNRIRRLEVNAVASGVGKNQVEISISPEANRRSEMPNFQDFKGILELP